MKNTKEIKKENKKTKAEKDNKKETVKGDNTKDTSVIKVDDTNSNLEILPEVISTIATVEIEKNKNVRKSTNWIDAFGSKTSKGIKIDITKNDVKIEISILTLYGQRIPEIAYSLQNDIKREVENMTGLRVLEVNVHVQGIFLEENDDLKEEN